MTQSKNCVFVTVPFTDTINPLMAPAILKSIAQQAGRTSTTIDLNAVFLHHLNDLTEDVRHKLISFFKEEKWHEDTVQLLFNLLHQMAQRILEHQPEIVGISVFTYDCRVATKYLSWFLKKINPSIKIIIGGPGILHHFSGHAKFAEDLQKQGVIDFFVYGDGEKALYHYLTTGNSKFVGINSHTWLQLSREEIELLPRPDYTDYDFSLYRELFGSAYRDQVGIPVLGSRGCVRQCTFCDYHVHWEKFTYRSGQHIFDELVEFHQKFKINRFHFTDSLVNGNLREYRNMTELLADYNQKLPDSERITWGGFFIFRSKSAFTENDWKLTSDSGGRVLNVGIETINDSVRKELGKNFTNEDIDYAFDMAQKYGSKITFNLLFFTGYPSETDEDYEYQVQWWRDRVEKYRDVIKSANSGTPLGILANTPLERDFDKLGLVRTGPAPEDWVNPANGNTPEKRIKWNSMIVNVLKECGIPNVVGHDTHYILERMKHSND